MRYPRLMIEHNHGFLLLADASVANGEATGEVIDGATTSRLFWATSTVRDTPGAVGRYWVYGRAPEPVWSVGGAESGRWVESPTPGAYRLSCVSCG